MTIPNITQPTVIRARERPNYAQAFLDAFQAGQQLAIRRQELALDREKFAEQQRMNLSEAAYRGVLTDEAKGRLKELEARLKATEEETADIAEASEAIQRLMQSGSINDPDTVKTVAGELKRPGAVNRFHTALQEAATARGANVRAGMLERLPEIIKEQTPQAGQALGTMATLGLAGAPSTPTELAKLGVRGFEGLVPPSGVTPQEWGQVLNHMRITGKPLGEARRVFGIPAIPGVDDATTARDLSRSNRQAQQVAMRNAGLVQVMEPNAAVLDSIGRLGLRGESLLLLTGGNIFSDVARTAVNLVTDAEQKQFVTAGLAFVDGWRVFITGAQASRQELSGYLREVLERAGDDDGTKSMKKILRQLMVRAVREAALGEAEGDPTPGVSAAQNILQYIEANEASNPSFRPPPAIKKFFQDQLARAKIAAPYRGRLLSLRGGLPPGVTLDDPDEAMGQIEDIINRATVPTIPLP